MVSYRDALITHGENREESKCVCAKSCAELYVKVTLSM